MPRARRRARTRPTGAGHTEDLLAKRRGGPRWVRLLSWVVAVAVWLWIINGFVVRNWPPTSEILANPSASLVLNSLFFVAVATVMAAFAMFLVRLVGRGVAWLNLRFVEGE